ncbi:MAG: hypothetical protein ACYDBJ_04405 [Aggregatilineales bacterium]
MTFDIRQDIFNEDGDLEEQADDYINQVLTLFDTSPEGQALATQGLETSWTAMILNYAFGYVGVELPEMDAGTLEEILFELIPEKVVMQPSSAPDIVTEARAFWTFLKREFGLPNADSCLALLNQQDIIEQLRTSLANPAHYGMSKSIIMEGMRRGFDIGTKEGMEKWFLIHNQEAAARMKNAPPSLTQFPGLPAGRDLNFWGSSALSKGRPKVDKKKKSKRKMEKASRKRNRR